MYTVKEESRKVPGAVVFFISLAARFFQLTSLWSISHVIKCVFEIVARIAMTVVPC